MEQMGSIGGYTEVSSFLHQNHIFSFVIDDLTTLDGLDHGEGFCPIPSWVQGTKVTTGSLALKKESSSNQAWDTGDFISSPVQILHTPNKNVAQALCFVGVLQKSYCACSLFEKLSSFYGICPLYRGKVAGLVWLMS